MMMLHHGEDVQKAKVIEEINELEEAIKGTDREHIVEEFSDVLNVLPYITIMFGIKIQKPFFKYNLEKWNYKFMIRMVYYCMKYSGNSKRLVRGALTDFVRIYMVRLGEIKKQYNIKDSEVEVWIKRKRLHYTKKVLKIG